MAPVMPKAGIGALPFNPSISPAVLSAIEREPSQPPFDLSAPLPLRPHSQWVPKPIRNRLVEAGMAAVWLSDDDDALLAGVLV